MKNGIFISFMIFISGLSAAAKQVVLTSNYVRVSTDGEDRVVECRLRNNTYSLDQRCFNTASTVVDESDLNLLEKKLNSLVDQKINQTADKTKAEILGTQNEMIKSILSSDELKEIIREVVREERNKN